MSRERRPCTKPNPMQGRCGVWREKWILTEDKGGLDAVE